MPTLRMLMFVLLFAARAVGATTGTFDDLIVSDEDSGGLYYVRPSPDRVQCSTTLISSDNPPEPGSMDFDRNLGGVVVDVVNQRVDGVSLGGTTPISSGGMLSVPLDITIGPGPQIFVTNFVDVLEQNILQIDPTTRSQSLCFKSEVPPLRHPLFLVAEPSGSLVALQPGGADGFDPAELYRVTCGPDGAGTATSISSGGYMLATSAVERDSLGRFYVTSLELPLVPGLPNLVRVDAGVQTLLHEGAPFQRPVGLAVAADDSLLIVDSFARSIFRWDDTNGLTTLCEDLPLLLMVDSIPIPEPSPLMSHPFALPMLGLLAARRRSRRE